MAHIALGVVTPFAVAVQTLAMVCAFKSRLSQIVRISFAAVTLFTWWYLTGRRKVMASLAIGTHFCHTGMPFMIEMHRAVQIGNFIEENFIGGFRQTVNRPFLMRRGQCGAWLQAHIFRGRILAGMALLTIERRQIGLHCLSGDNTGAESQNYQDWKDSHVN
jgi:hypothetical protein